MKKLEDLVKSKLTEEDEPQPKEANSAKDQKRGSKHPLTRTKPVRDIDETGRREKREQGEHGEHNHEVRPYTRLRKSRQKAVLQEHLNNRGLLGQYQDDRKCRFRAKRESQGTASCAKETIRGVHQPEGHEEKERTCEG